MDAVQNRKGRSLTIILLIIAGEVIFFLPFLVPRIFRPTMLSVFDISNTELGLFFSAYGIVAMISYLFGGPLADRFPARKLMAIALWLTAVGGIVMTFVPGPVWIILIYGFWGFTTIFLFWAAMIRATREWGGEGFQGRAFGWLEGGRGMVAATLGTLSWLIFARLTPAIETLATDSAFLGPFQVVILTVSLSTALTGGLVWSMVPDNRQKLERDPPGEVIKKIGILIRLPALWALAVVIICAYAGYKITDDFSLYAREVLGFSEVGAAATGTAALWLRGIVAVLAGLLADRLDKAKMITLFFGITCAGALLTGFGVIEWSSVLILLNMTALATGIYGIRALYFAVLKEAGIPLALTGTAVGIVSFLGYTPDVFMSPWMGYLLDSQPGIVGHRSVFMVLAGFAVTGLLATLVFRHYSGISPPR